MNIGAFGENFPYTNFHDMNLDWIVKIAKDFLDQYSSIQELIDSGMSSLQEKYDTLEGLLNQWYETHSEDIANQLADALQDISNTLSLAISNFDAHATQKAEEVIQSIPSDYTELDSKVDNLENLVELINQNGFTRLTDDYYSLTDQIIKGDGTGTVSFAGWNTTPYTPIVSPSTIFKGNGFEAEAYNTFCLYDASYNVLYMGRGAFEIKASDYPTAKYFRAAEDIPTRNYYVDIDTNQYEYIIKLVELFSLDGALPDSWLTNQNKLMQGNGTTISNFNGFNLSDIIPIINRNVHFYGKYFPSQAYCTFALYDENMTPVYIPFGTQHINLNDYPTAAYFRFGDSTDHGFQNYIGQGTRNVRFEIGSGKFYETIKDGFANAIKFDNSIVTVFPGTYNLATEFAAEITAASGSSGVFLDRHIEAFFMSGSYVKALFPTSNAYISTYFQPFRGKDFIIHNLNIEASNCRYAFHDEQASSPIPYRNVFDNCVMKMTSVASSGATTIVPQCIGGGLGEHGIIEIIGGHYFSNGDADASGEKVTISYHNGSSANCDNRIIIRDVYLDGTIPGRFRFTYYGTSTHETSIEVSGCSMALPILKRAETPQSTTDNIQITEWNNVIRQ